MFSPKWKKEAKLLDKAAKKFLNYKRDLLSEQQTEEIESRLKDLRNAYKGSNRDKCEEASKQLKATCEGSLPRHKPQGWLEENLEVFFVAIVIALGLRAYVVQPFRIPTGSMQPTLNGIVATPLDDAEFPNFATRQIQRVTHGRSYVDLVLKEEKKLRTENPIVERNFLHFFTNTDIHFEDGSKMTFPGPPSTLLSANGMNFASKIGLPMSEQGRVLQIMSLGLQISGSKQSLADWKKKARNKGISYDTNRQTGTPTGATYANPVLPAGTVIARGYVDSGDLILVDKMSYHFRKPSRGEVFVFDTRDITYIQKQTNPGSHYIKRLAGIPGDELELRDVQPNLSGDLYINGERAKEDGFARVMSRNSGYNGYGATDYLAPNTLPFKARKSNIPGMNEYIALGDNSFNSSDSRRWGTVKEFNVIGPASFTLWPFGSGHWGPIK